MHMLESAMAFAVVMIIFSTIVTGLVEAILRLLALKQRALGRALTRVLADEVQPALVEALTQAKKAVTGAEAAKGKIDEIVESFTANPLTKRAPGLKLGWLERRMQTDVRR